LIRIVINEAMRPERQQYLGRIVQKYAKSASRLADWLEKNIPEGLAVFAFPATHPRRLRTSDSLERVNRELDRRTTVVSLFPTEASCLRLVSAVLIEQDEEWQSDRIYLSFENASTASQP
jgi:putative transposase